MVNFYRPRCVIRNISNNAINLLGYYRLKPGKSVDLFQTSNTGDKLQEWAGNQGFRETLG